MELTWGLFVAVVALAMLCQFVAVALGVGYGTALAPLLIIIGFQAHQLVPAVLLSQLAGGIVGGIAHHRAGNIQLDFRRDDKLIKERLRGLGYLPRSIDAKVVFILVSFGVIGVLVGVFTAVNISEYALGIYIGVLVLAVGLTILSQRTRKIGFSWKSIIALGVVGAFNKGMTGGGYVPLVTGGQIISGRETKSSVGSTTVSIAVLCAVGFLGYLLAGSESIDWELAGVACIGAVIASPFAALTTKKMKTERLKVLIGVATILLGALTLIKVFLF